MDSFSAIRKKVLGQITPTSAERRAEEKMTQFLLRKIRKMKGRHTRALLAGSLARDTHLRGDRDLDIFVLFPKNMKRELFEKAGLKIGHTIFGDNSHEEAYSEHPYVRGTIDGFHIEIVPAYDVKSAPEKISAVDRTPFHLNYVRKKLSPTLCKEVRLLKQFLKGIGVYGADIRYHGVPGYLVELLIIHYGSFLSALEGISSWKEETLITFPAGKKSTHSDEHSLPDLSLFPEKHLIVLDPTDPSRNVAAALSKNQMARMVLASRMFLKEPSLSFFSHHQAPALSVKSLQRFFRLGNYRGIRINCPPDVIADVVWGQLQRVTGKLANQLAQDDFVIRRTFWWTNGETDSLILFEVESEKLSPTLLRKGPSVFDAEHALKFMEAHPRPISGPRVENGHVILEIPRKKTHFSQSLKEETARLARTEKSPLNELFQKATPVSEASLLALAKKHPDLRKDLSAFLKGKEPFL